MTATDIQALLQSIIAVQYYFFFPGSHLNVQQTDPFGGKQLVDEYQGDWQCFIVYLKPPTSNAEFESLSPFHVAVSATRRGVSSNLGSTGIWTGFTHQSWSTASTIEDHVLLIARGNGNELRFVASDSTDSNPGIKPQSGDFGYGVVDPIGKWGEELIKENQNGATAAVAATIAKIVAGASIFGPVGAFVGLIAGIAEAGEVMDAVNHGGELPDFDFDKKVTEVEFGEPEEDEEDGVGTHSLVVALDSTVDINKVNLRLISANPNAAPVAESRVWLTNSLVEINASTEPFWWHSAGSERRGFAGRWGVRCEHDPFQRRAGGVLPDYGILAVRHVLLRQSSS
jgi:hypothetical protein